MNLKPEDLGVIIALSVICLTLIIFKILNNGRRVTRNTLHGTVTYTIKGYSGPETVRIAKALERSDKIPSEPDELEHRTVLTKATSEDVRR